MRNHVFDNRDFAVVDYLREHLADADEFSIISAYFIIYGYGLLASQVAHVPKTRFLFGDPSSVWGTLLFSNLTWLEWTQIDVPRVPEFSVANVFVE